MTRAAGAERLSAAAPRLPVLTQPPADRPKKSLVGPAPLGHPGVRPHVALVAHSVAVPPSVASALCTEGPDHQRQGLRPRVATAVDVTRLDNATKLRTAGIDLTCHKTQALSS